MLHRAFPLAALAALLACLPDVEQTAQPNEIVLARFDTTTGVIPFPNDLALQSASTLPAGVTKTTLETFINAGGFPAAVVTPPAGSVLIPVRAFAKAADGTYSAPGTAPVFDNTALNAAGAIAFLRYDVNPPAQVPFQAQFAPQLPATSPVAGPAIVVAPTAALAAGGRYVVALRSGIQTTDGRAIGADQAIALIAPNKDLATTPENRPPGLSDALAKRLDAVRQTFANPLPWTRIGAPIPGAAGICQQANQNPAATAPCWLPCTPTLAAAVAPAGLCKPLANGAAEAPFAAIDTVFPHQDVASIQTFNLAP